MFMLITLSILLLLLLLFLIIILWSPIVFILDSKHDEMVLRLGGLAYCKLYLVDNSILVSIRITFYSKKFDLVEKLIMRPEALPNGRKKALQKAGSGRMINRFKRRLRKVLLTFRIKRFYVNMDFGNNLLTGMLYPVFFLVREYGMDVHTNFNGNREIMIVIENRLIRVAHALFF